MSDPHQTPERASADRAALVIGGTGLVGTALVSQLLEDPDYDRVVTFGRRRLEVEHDKLQQHLVDFDDLGSFRSHLEGEVLFSALGTTRKKAGSKEAQRRVDYDYQLQVAEAAAENGVPGYVLVSALGASCRSPFFYSRMKGQLEDRVRDLPFESIRILRPGLLDGERGEDRPGEKWTLRVLRHVPRMESLARVRPIHAQIVARAARCAAADWAPDVQVLFPEQLFVLGEGHD